MTKHRRLIVSALLAVLALTGQLSAQTGRLPQSLLWRVMSPKGAVSYVFGTIHAPDTNVFYIRDTVVSLIGQSKVYASELNLDSMFRQMMDPSLLVMKNKTLYDLYDSSTVDEICTKLGELAKPLASACPRMKPSIIGMMIMMQSMEKTASTSLDERLWSKARKLKIKRVGLETVGEQLATLDEQPPEALLEMIRGNDDSIEELRKLTRLYIDENLDSLDAMTRDTSITKKTDLTSLNDKRNQRFVKRMIPLINEGGAFFAIGALHLAGPSSVLTLLANNGYSVDPVMGGRRRNVLDKNY